LAGELRRRLSDEQWEEADALLHTEELMHHLHHEDNTEEVEPADWRRAIDSTVWKESMKKEIADLVANSTWTLEQTPQGGRL
jgi:hypothetical protein